MNNPSVRQRVGGAFLANGFARAMRIADQLLMVPLLLSAWGADQYGEWIALCSVASFATLASLGLGSAGCSNIVLRHASGDQRGAGRSFITFAILITLS